MLRCPAGYVLVAGEGAADLVGELLVGGWVASEVPGDTAEECGSGFGACNAVEGWVRLVRCLWLGQAERGWGLHDISGIAAHLFHCE